MRVAGVARSSAPARALIIAVATLAGVSATGRLGWWQLDRAAQKEALQHSLDSRSVLPPLRLAELATTADGAFTQHDRRIEVQGRWLASATVFLDNRQMNGRAGFVVVTPLLPADGSTAVLVQRGFTPRDNDDRSRLPALPTPADVVVRVAGRIAPPPARLYEFAASPPGSIRQNLDPEAFAQEIGRPLRPLSIVQDAPTVAATGDATPPDGLQRQWPRPAVDVQKHYGYAFQWFALCALMAGLYVWFQLVRPGSGARSAELLSPLGLTVHSMPLPPLAEPDDDVAAADPRRTASGRWRMLAVLAVCAAPVVASYFTYFVVRPQARSNYSELITPPRELPAALPLRTLAGEAVRASTLRGQWLLVVVADAACDAGCERHLLLQRQLRETLGRDKDRVDKLWLVTGDGAPRPAVLQAIGGDSDPAVGRSSAAAAGHTRPATPNFATTVRRVDAADLARWLTPAAGQRLDDHLYLVDPMGQWMMRTPVDPDPAKLKRDLERLLRASASWDTPGR